MLRLHANFMKTEKWTHPMSKRQMQDAQFGLRKSGLSPNHQNHPITKRGWFHSTSFTEMAENCHKRFQRGNVQARSPFGVATGQLARHFWIICQSRDMALASAPGCVDQICHKPSRLGSSQTAFARLGKYCLILNMGTE